jgi:hypothetical protein
MVCVFTGIGCGAGELASVFAHPAFAKKAAAASTVTDINDNFFKWTILVKLVLAIKMPPPLAKIHDV